MKVPSPFPLIACTVLLAAHAASSSALGDLMMTEKQRSKIEAMRNGNLAPQPEDTAPTPEVATSLKVNGLFFKNGDNRQQGVIWINGEQVEDNHTTGEAYRLKGLDEQQKSISIRQGQSETFTTLKPGQKLHLYDGNIKDAFEP